MTKIDINKKYKTREGNSILIYKIHEIYVAGVYRVHGAYLNRMSFWESTTWSINGENSKDKCLNLVEVPLFDVGYWYSLDDTSDKFLILKNDCDDEYPYIIMDKNNNPFKMNYSGEFYYPTIKSKLNPQIKYLKDDNA